MANTTAPSLQDIFPSVEAAATVATFGTVEVAIEQGEPAALALLAAPA